MFVDKVTIEAKAGNGGNGIVSFRHEKFVDKGGPDGGDGGKGGDVVLVASTNENTLARFRYDKRVYAQDGQAGNKRNQHGRNGVDVVVNVPVGTVALTDKGTALADLTEDGQRVVIAIGGQGGFGNAHFKSSTRQTPRLAEKGEVGERFDLTLELKMIADVGLIGLPNAGKSTLLARISNARPEIADYPFTTLTPNLGVVDVDSKTSLLFADIPGLIEGASQGKGLGGEFLRHIERTAVLVHLIDAWQNNIQAAYKTIRTELKAHNPALVRKPEIVVLSKIDGLDDEIVGDRLRELREILPPKTTLLSISANSGAGIKELLYEVKRRVASLRRRQQAAEKKRIPVIGFTEPEQSWQIKKVADGFIVSGKKIERFAARTDFENWHGVARLRDIMRKMGIANGLEKHGIAPGMYVFIGVDKKYHVEW